MVATNMPDRFSIPLESRAGDLQTVKIRLTIEGTYQVRPGGEGYEDCQTVEDCVEADLAAVEDRLWDIEEFISVINTTAHDIKVIYD